MDGKSRGRERRKTMELEMEEMGQERGNEEVRGKRERREQEGKE